MLNKYENQKEKLNIPESPRSVVVIRAVLAIIIIVIHIVLLVVLFSEF